MTPHELVTALRRRGLTLELAEEGASRAFVVRYARPRTFDSAQHEAAWLVVVGTREALRERREAGAAQLEDRTADPRCDVAQNVEDRCALALVQTLRPMRRAAVAARMVGLSYAEAAAAFGWSARQVERHTTEGRAELRELVQA